MAEVGVVYQNGIRAEIRFRHEPSGWRLDLSRDLAPNVRIREDICVIKEAFETSRLLKEKPVSAP